MASVLNRTTLQYLQSVNTPDYSAEEWIINPDLSAVAAVDQRYWKLVGDQVVEMTQAEKDAVDAAGLPETKLAKYAEIDARTDQLIYEGFMFAGKRFSLSLGAQLKMIGTNQVRARPEIAYPIVWNTIDDADKHQLVDADEVLAFYLQGVGTYRAHVDSGTELKDQVRAATTIAAVQAVEDAR